jgi:hypothetical protein
MIARGGEARKSQGQLAQSGLELGRPGWRARGHQ